MGRPPSFDNVIDCNDDIRGGTGTDTARIDSGVDLIDSIETVLPGFLG